MSQWGRLREEQILQLIGPRILLKMIEALKLNLEGETIDF